MALLDKFSGADIAAMMTGFMAMAAIVIGAYWQHRKGRDGDDEEPPPKPKRAYGIEFGDRSMNAIERLTDVLHEQGRRLGDAVGDHRDAIEDQTRALKQKE